MPVAWDDATDAILAGDLTAALGYRTPAGGVVVQAVAPIGLRDRAAGTVGFTTSLGFSKKLERIARDPRVAMAFHAREHGRARSERYVLVQGRARVIADPSPEQRAEVRQARRGRARARAPRLVLGPLDARVLRGARTRARRRRADRDLARPALRRGAAARTARSCPRATRSRSAGRAAAPRPRLDAARAGRRVRATAHTLLGYAGADGRPLIVPVEAG